MPESLITFRLFPVYLENLVINQWANWQKINQLHFWNWLSFINLKFDICSVSIFSSLSPFPKIGNWIFTEVQHGCKLLVFLVFFCLPLNNDGMFTLLLYTKSLPGLIMTKKQIADKLTIIGYILTAGKSTFFCSCGTQIGCFHDSVNSKNYVKSDLFSSGPFSYVVLYKIHIWFLLMWQLCERPDQNSCGFSPTEHAHSTVTSLFTNCQQWWTKPNMEDGRNDDWKTGVCKFNRFMGRCFFSPSYSQPEQLTDGDHTTATTANNATNSHWCQIQVTYKDEWEQLRQKDQI